MDKFLALTEEKRLTILNAALQCFGKFGYEKASINDIAVAAHISKASVFQYFGSKKQLYIYLLEYCKKTVSYTHLDVYKRQAQRPLIFLYHESLHPTMSFYLEIIFLGYILFM